MRWLRLVALVVSFLLVMAGSTRSHGFARELTKQNRPEARTERRPSTSREASSSSVAVVPVDLLVDRRCKSKVLGFCGFLAQDKKHNSTLDDEKRVVPTGPNPLHNR